jgi:hypothetical protein
MGFGVKLFGIFLIGLSLVSALPRHQAARHRFQSAFASSSNFLRSEYGFVRKILAARKGPSETFKFAPIKLSNEDGSAKSSDDAKEIALRKIAGMDKPEPTSNSESKEDPGMVDQLWSWINSKEVCNNGFISSM